MCHGNNRIPMTSPPPVDEAAESPEQGSPCLASDTSTRYRIFPSVACMSFLVLKQQVHSLDSQCSLRVLSVHNSLTVFAFLLVVLIVQQTDWSCEVNGNEIT
ncbi:hypothetical protein AVEN_84994-1 [Araneus ventricosus]|uniref:Uncharacterized protein n=1 Tax=Araneus ventricosus TaxID=182803 RepID=A0A4Y2BZ09_ARAVE|nr:hypothetical protein AVEN_84994-1 [Araneus ventricosus]